MGDEDEQVPRAFETIELLGGLLTDPTKTEEELVTLAWLREPSLCQDDNLHLPPEEISRNNRWASLVYLFFLA
jgi:hypothetical protein